MSDLKSVNTDMVSGLKTNDPTMTTVSLGDVMLADFEVDTAASHSVMSSKVYGQLSDKLGDLPGKKQNVIIRFADGTVSSKSYGTVQVKIQAFEGKPL